MKSPTVNISASFRCTCLQGYLGNGKFCYGNIVQRLKELNTEPGGTWLGQLSNALTLFGINSVLHLMHCSLCFHCLLIFTFLI